MFALKYLQNISIRKLVHKIIYKQLGVPPRCLKYSWEDQACLTIWENGIRRDGSQTVGAKQLQTRLVSNTLSGDKSYDGFLLVTENPHRDKQRSDHKALLHLSMRQGLGAMGA